MERYKDYEQFDVFLSHSVDDADLVLGVMRLLQAQGLKVYVDWIVDKQLDRETVDKETAQILRERMKRSKSLIYVVTSNSSGSKWMPWELGFFDGYQPDQVAILPLMDSANESFRGQEYLGLYPLVTKYIKGVDVNHFIEDRENKWANFKAFAKGVPTWSKY